MGNPSFMDEMNADPCTQKAQGDRSYYINSRYAEFPFAQ